jgi:pyruvate dehydrogenase E2 component (dihydrolipoamide acetyltransferase)
MADASASATRDFVMPSLGADMEAGTVLRWRVAPGDRVARGDIVVEVETEKAEMEVEIFDDGVVEGLVAAVGEKVPVGGVLARIRASGAPRPVAAAPPAPAAPTPQVAVSAPPPMQVRTAAPTSAAPAARKRITPLARRIAEDLGVDVAQVAGTGPGGSVTADDVRALRAAPTAAPARPPAASPREREPAERSAARQRVVAALMERSKREIPHYYLSASIDLTPALAWLEARNRGTPVSERILPAALLLRAVALALPAAPELSGHYENGAFRAAPALHLGVAIALRGGGLIAPAILDAGAKPLGDWMRALRDLGERARSGKLRASEMSSATLTVTSLGDGGVDAVQAVIYPPQVAIVGFGTPAQRPWVDREGGLCVRTIVQATLAADHRVSNGHRGALFLKALERALLEPERLA